MTWAYQLLLWIASIYLTTGSITFDQREMEVDENGGSVMLCLETDEMILCLHATSQANEAEEGKDYRSVNTILMITGGSECVRIDIIDDDTPESDESFAVIFSELEPEASRECSQSVDDGSAGSGGSGMPGTTVSLQPMVTNETVVITIKDDDSDSGNKEGYSVMSTASAIAGIIGALIILITVTLICGIVCNYYRRRKRRMKLRKSNGIDGSHIEINPILMDQVQEREEEEDGTDSHGEIHDYITDVPPSEFAAYVKELHKDADKDFSQQYVSLQTHTPKLLPCKAAELEENAEKNRYHNILPYDRTRVVLSKTKKGQSDYINANWIDGYRREKTYVTCQGPLPETVGDFWRMMWELKVPTIVMLTKTQEASKPKCEHYWPKQLGEMVTIDDNMTVLLKDVVPFADYEIRNMILSNGSDKHNVTHYLFMSWPDHGVPRYATALLGFIRHIRKCHFPSDPATLVVHCSAGVGRTGTFIVLDIMLQVLEAKAGINVYECILKLRTQRCHMVQTEAQYIFIHDALEELITCGKTEISVTDLRIAMSRLNAILPDTQTTGFDKQLQLLQKVSRQPLKKDLEISQKIFNVEKNRYSHILPYDFQRVCLKGRGQPGSDYINASWINGYRQSNSFIVTQAPLKNTISDVWRMIWEMSCKTIVLLCDLQENDKEVCVQYWPEKDKQVYGNLTVSNVGEQELNDSLCTRIFEVYHNGSLCAPVPDVMKVTQFHFRGWCEDGLPSDPSQLLGLIDRVLKNQQSTGNKPVVVMCNDGSGRSGTFVVLYSQLERLKAEHVVDVFQGLKAARIQRMGLVHNVECYKVIHEVLLQYLTSFEEKNYDNFTI